MHDLVESAGEKNVWVLQHMISREKFYKNPGIEFMK